MLRFITYKCYGVHLKTLKIEVTDDREIFPEYVDTYNNSLHLYSITLPL